MNIFYKYQIDVITMGIGGDNKYTVSVNIEILESKYVEYLQDLDVLSEDHYPERYTFLNMTISLLESLIKKTITNEIRKNIGFYDKHWRMMLINGRGATPTTYPLFKNMKNDKKYSIQDAIPKFFSYQSFLPINLMIDSFSYVENFIEKEFSETNEFKENMKLFFNARNESTHNLKDIDANLANVIKNDLPKFIESIKKIVITSLEYRYSIEKIPCSTEDLRILKTQNNWLTKIQKAITHKALCGKCDICLDKLQNGCKERIMPERFWQISKNKKIQKFDKEFISDFNFLIQLSKKYILHANNNGVQ